MTKETKVRLLTIILNAGIKGTDREMLDNLKAVVKSIESENYGLPSIKSRTGVAQEELAEIVAQEKRADILLKEKPGRPPKKR